MDLCLTARHRLQSGISQPDNGNSLRENSSQENLDGIRFVSWVARPLSQVADAAVGTAVLAIAATGRLRQRTAGIRFCRDGTTSLCKQTKDIVRRWDWKEAVCETYGRRDRRTCDPGTCRSPLLEQSSRRPLREGEQGWQNASLRRKRDGSGECCE